MMECVKMGDVDAHGAIGGGNNLVDKTPHQSTPKRTRTPGSSGGKTMKRFCEDRNGMESESSWAIEVENDIPKATDEQDEDAAAGGGKDGRGEGAEGATSVARAEPRMPEGVKKREMDSAPVGGKRLRTWADRARSAHLITVTKGGPNYLSLTREEHERMAEALEEAIFEENSTKPPSIDWVSWKNDKSMIACADQAAVAWVKEAVTCLDDQLGAWLPNEGPNERKKFVIKIPFPTARRPANEVVDRIVVGNELEGLMTVVKEIRTERALVLVLGADQEMTNSLQSKNFRVTCGIARLSLREFAAGGGACYNCQRVGHVAKRCPWNVGGPEGGVEALPQHEKTD